MPHKAALRTTTQREMTPKNRHTIQLLLLATGCLLSLATFGLPTDKAQPIHIAAQTATLDQKKGVTIYSGDVQFTQGTMLVKADVVTAHFDAQTQKIEKIHAEGSPARYQQQPEVDKGTMVIEARTVTALFNTGTQKIEKIEAEGTPASFKQQPSLEKGVITAQANNISYMPTDQQLLLLTNASLEQDGASMNANKIVYDLLKEVMQAAGNTQSDQQRIEIIIPPNMEP
jgi:lipopolysaccharide export system protein LptA